MLCSLPQKLRFDDCCLTALFFSKAGDDRGSKISHSAEFGQKFQENSKNQEEVEEEIDKAPALTNDGDAFQGCQIVLKFYNLNTKARSNMRLCSHGEKANLTRSCCKLHFPTLLESCKRERMALTEINLFGNPDYDIVFTALAHEDQENMENVDHLCRGRTEQRKMPAEKSKSLKGI